MVDSEVKLNDLSEKVVVGSRKSELALIQTHHVIKLLEKQYPEKKFDITTMATLGDKILDKPLPKIGEKSLFTKELEAALEAGSVQLVVHSLKDLPTTLPEGMAVGAVLAREDPRDAVVLHRKFKGKDLSSLPEGSVIGTSSLRRAAQLGDKFSHLKVENIRGNLNTRLRKLDEDDKYSAIILAMAGLNRMGWEARISQVLEGSQMMYAVGQGALAVECREDDIQTLQILESLHDWETALRVVAERSFLRTLGGGCSAPVAVVSKLVVHKETGEKKLELEGGVWSLDGQKALKSCLSCTISADKEECESDGEPPRKSAHVQRKTFCGIVAPLSNICEYEAASSLGENLASDLMKQGATDIMEEARKHNESK